MPQNKPHIGGEEVKQDSGAIPIEGGVAAAYRRGIESAPDPEARRREL